MTQIPDDPNPYRAPLAPAVEPAPLPAAERRTYVYRSAGGLVATLTVLLIVNTVLSAAECGAMYSRVSLLERAKAAGGGGLVRIEEGQAKYSRIAALAAAALICFLVTAIVFWVWEHRANRNARALGARGMEFTPGWCVGWWFVPLANLVQVPKSVAELWRASDPAADSLNWPRRPGTPLVGFWWASYFIGRVVLAQVALVMQPAPGEAKVSLDLFITASWMNVASHLFSGAAAVLCLLLVRKIHARQERKSLSPATSPGGPTV